MKKKVLISILVLAALLQTGVSFAQESVRDVFDYLDSVLASHEDKTPTLSPKTISYGKVILGNEVLFTDFEHLINGKKIGLVTNQTGVNSKGESTVDKFYNHPSARLVAAYSPEHGLDGKTKAGAYVMSYTDTKRNLPVYSLYGKTRKPSKQMLEGVDVLVFDMQDIGSRTYTYMSTLNYVMKAAAQHKIPVIVLDRPNPLGGIIVEGHVAKDKYLTFVGVDNLPLAHGMTCGELARFFNRNIHADLTVIPMKNYSRSMIWQDTGLPFAQTSPNIPDIESAFLYMATGMGEGTGIGQANKFHWIGGKNIDSVQFADKLNRSGLSGVRFEPSTINNRGGVKVIITDYHTFNPAKTGIYTLATANLLRPIQVPTEKNGVIPMFEKLFGSDAMGRSLKKKESPEEIVASYQKELNEFKSLRQQYLIYP
ncbi:MAG: DUF1343 domain-containing protein [Filifactor alocis]|nr:DUF1343 domain-containing protein [Filifactor alocis]